MVLNGVKFGQTRPSGAKLGKTFAKQSLTVSNEVKQAHIGFNSGKQGKTRVKWV